MLFRTIIKVALKSLIAHKLRSFLAMLGIIIGVGSVVSMLAIAAGAQASLMQRISSMGTNLLAVRPGQFGFHGVMTGAAQKLEIDDAQAILDQVSGIARVTPIVRGSAQIKFMNKNTRAPVFGASPTYFHIRNFEIDKGRLFNETESETSARVAVLGPKTAADLFSQDDPLDEMIKLKGINFRVIGVLKSKGDQGGFNIDDQAVVPYTTAMKQVLGSRQLDEIDIEVTKAEDSNQVKTDITTLLRQRHRIQSGQQDDFNVQSQAEIQEFASTAMRMFTVLLGGIGGISLLVGGIGIMNIMLVTVTERTREIGLRKAVGAKDRDIMQQFLLEAVTMTGLGGTLGIAAGFGMARIIQSFGQLTPVVTPFSVLLSLGFSAFVGIFFGFYPAWRAAKLDPIDALRYE